MIDSTQTAEQTREAAIREYSPMPDDVRRHACTANRDLHFGPYSTDFWQEEENDPKQPLYSFGDSLDAFAKWVRELNIVYYDVDSGMILTDEPSGYWTNTRTGETLPDGSPYQSGSGWEFVDCLEYREIDAKAVADAYGYAMLLTYA